MNFLAHIYLSGENPQILLGNFIADMVKGKKIYDYKPDIIEGIKLHRMIDEFTDNHKTVEKSKKRLRIKYRHYSPVIVDMYYDHFLAKYWTDYCNKSLNQVLSNAYNVLLKNYLVLPAKGKRILPFMIANNWLGNYADIDSLKKNFEGMAKRTDFKSGMENATQDLIKDYDKYLVEFKEFFPELQSFVHNYRKDLI